jgi:siroheme synthase
LAAIKPGQNTLVVYMGVATASLIAHRLLDAGWAAETPVIAVENASRADERRIAFTLAALVAEPERLGLQSPAVLIFGDVAGLADASLVEDVLSLEEVRRAYA